MQGNIACDIIMNKNTLTRIRRKIAKLRDKDVPSVRLESIAASLGMRRIKVGSEPVWVFDTLPKLRPIKVPIPHHGKPVIRYTAGSILDDFDRIAFELEEVLENEAKH